LIYLLLFIHFNSLLQMSRTLLAGLSLLAVAATASAQTTNPPAPATIHHTTSQKTTTRRTTAKPARTTVRKSTSKKVGMVAPANRGAAVVSRQWAATAPKPASGKGQGVYAAPGEPVDIQNAATMGYDGAAPRRAKTTTTTSNTLAPR
jgi:hypothetical protein